MNEHLSLYRMHQAGIYAKINDIKKLNKKIELQKCLLDNYQFDKTQKSLLRKGIVSNLIQIIKESIKQKRTDNLKNYRIQYRLYGGSIVNRVFIKSLIYR